MAQTYSLVVEIDVESLRIMDAAALRIVVAKQSTTGSANVAWVAWPARRTTTVAWAETYGLYAASAALARDDRLRITATAFPAIDRAVYPFRNELFGLPVSDDGIPPRHFDVRNDSAFAATFGLLQAATVDGTPVRGPVNAAVAPPGFTADFTPLTTLRIWAGAVGDGGTVVAVPPHASVVPYDTERRAMHVRYEAHGGRFVPALL